MIAVWLCLPGRTGLAQEDWSAQIDTAAACYARFDYDCVIDVMAGFSVAQAADSTPRYTLALGVHVLAVTYIVRGVPLRARTILYDMLLVSPDYQLEGDDLSPRFLIVFYEAKALLAAERAANLVRSHAGDTVPEVAAAGGGRELALSVQQWARALASTAPAPPPSSLEPVDLRIELGPSFELLTGHDTDVFENSFGLSFRLATERLFGIVAELAVDWHRHAVKLSDVVEENEAQRLTILNFTGSLAYPWRWRKVRLILGAGAGYSAFGLESAFDRGGFLLEAVAKAQFFILERFGLSLELRPRVVFAEGVDGIEISSPLLIGLTLFVDLDFL